MTDKEISEISEISEMTNYTCPKCARVFSQKSHYTSHQKKKIDCSNKTNIEIVKSIIKNIEEDEKKEKYFDINDYKLLELPSFIPSSIISSETLFKIMAYSDAYMDECHGISFYVNVQYIDEGKFRRPAFGPYDILVLEKDAIISLSKNGDVHQFTEKDIKYFPMHMFFNYNIDIISKNPVKIIALKNRFAKAAKLLKYHTNNESIHFDHLNNGERIGIIRPPYFDPSNFNFIEIEKPLSTDEIFSILAEDSKDNKDNKDGFIHPIVINNIHLNILNHLNDIIILNEFVSVIIRNRNGSTLKLTVNDVKYLPIYLLRNAIVEINKNDENDENTELSSITFFHNKIPNIICDTGSFLFENGMVSIINES